MTIKTRPPTGKPSWPILLIAGAEKTGKSWACAEASASKLIGRTFWVSCGEDDPDEYGALPGARLEIVLHDGTYRGMLNALRQAAADPAKDGKPNLIVLDSASRLWSLLSDMGQAEANRRDRVKAEKFKRAPPEEDVPISMDLWNVAKDRWQDTLDVLRGHQGPSIVTARLDLVTVMENEKPTKEKVSKVAAEKHLPFDVGAVVEIPTRGEAFLTGVRSVRLGLTDEKPRKRLPKFTVEQLWTDLGLAEKGAAGTRTHVRSEGQASQAVEAGIPARRTALLDEIKAMAEQQERSLTDIAQTWKDVHRSNIGETDDIPALEAFRDGLRQPLKAVAS